MANPLPPLFEELRQRVDGALQAGSQLGQAAEPFLKQALSSALERLDLVSRSEFDQQQLLLEQAERRLADLEARLRLLESGPQSEASGESAGEPT